MSPTCCQWLSQANVNDKLPFLDQNMVNVNDMSCSFLDQNMANANTRCLDIRVQGSVYMYRCAVFTVSTRECQPCCEV